MARCKKRLWGGVKMVGFRRVSLAECPSETCQVGATKSSCRPKKNIAGRYVSFTKFSFGAMPKAGFSGASGAGNFDLGVGFLFRGEAKSADLEHLAAYPRYGFNYCPGPLNLQDIAFGPTCTK